MKINNFRGELTDVSAVKEALMAMAAAVTFLFYIKNHLFRMLESYGCFICMYLFTTVPHPHGHWQLQELLGYSKLK